MRPVVAIAFLSLMGVAGLCLAVGGWMQPAPSLTRTIRHLRRPGPDVRHAWRQGAPPVWGGLAHSISEALSRQPRLLPTEVQLRLLGRPLEHHVTYLAVAALSGALVPGLAVGALQRAGLIGLGWFVPAVAALGCAVLAPVLVHVSAIEHADLVRADLRYQVSAYLDVVTMLLAGNSGYEGALDEASRAGDGRLFAELRRRMREASARGGSLTDALHRAGAELGLEELEQVAATAALSAAEGAPVARTLAAKCATLRTALATEQESEARLRTSRLTTPIVGMALIFMALVIYPALSFS
jgi:Flp pilus assembly protein TadB